ncbi:hypothetical protein BVY03_04350 [bacterium K02(2017)]|nr:hypothetical protein BVY03_04350 [bacterium K02(2017)]
MSLALQPTNPILTPGLNLPKITKARIHEVVNRVNIERAKHGKSQIDPEKPLLHVAVGKSVFFDVTKGYSGPKNDLKAWSKFMADNAEVKLPQGRAYPFVRRLLDMNQLAPDPRTDPLVQVDFITQINQQAFPRIYNSLISHGLAKHMDRSLLTTTWLNYGTSSDANIEAVVDTIVKSGAHFYIASKKEYAEAVIENANIGAAQMLPDENLRPYDPSKPGILVFDGDGVLWGDGAERVFQNNFKLGLKEAKEQGMNEAQTEEYSYTKAVTEFNKYVYENRNNPESDGPASELFVRLNILNELWELDGDRRLTPFDIRLLTARGHIGQSQAFQYFAQNGIQVPQRASFMSGRLKNRYLVGADLYVEDSKKHLIKTENMPVEDRPQGRALIPAGVKNEGGITLETAPED